MSYIDFHCDTLLFALRRDIDNIYSLDGAMLDVQRLYESGALAQFFAVFFPPKPHPGHILPNCVTGEQPGVHPSVTTDDIALFEQARSILFRTLKQYDNICAFASNAADLERNCAAGKVSAFLTLEDGRAINGSLERMKWFYDKGVRLITLTWNHDNCFGYPNSRNPEAMRLGLTPFGREAIAYMNELGILIDVSHLSDGGFYDVAAHTAVPFIASHSNCRALTPHPRNLTDDMIRILADHGGVAGLNFGPDFVAETPGSRCTSVERLCAHAGHLLRIGGEDVVAIGTDFDGIRGDLEISQPTEIYRLLDALKAHGFSENQVEKAAFGNAKRVISDVL